MRSYQEEIYSAVVYKKNWCGSNTVVRTERNESFVFYYGNLIATVNHQAKTAHYDNCGYNNASTSARINAVKMACKDLNYKG